MASNNYVSNISSIAVVIKCIDGSTPVVIKCIDGSTPVVIKCIDGSTPVVIKYIDGSTFNHYPQLHKRLCLIQYHSPLHLS